MVKVVKEQGLLLVEIILAVAVFGMLTLVILSAFVYGREATSVSGDNFRASEVANAGLVAVENIADSSYANLSSYADGTTYYLSLSSNQWNLTTTPSTVDSIYTPAIVFSAGPGTSRLVKVDVTWQENSQRTGSVTAITVLTDWKAAT